MQHFLHTPDCSILLHWYAVLFQSPTSVLIDLSSVWTLKFKFYSIKPWSALCLGNINYFSTGWSIKFNTLVWWYPSCCSHKCLNCFHDKLSPHLTIVLWYCFHLCSVSSPLLLHNVWFKMYTCGINSWSTAMQKVSESNKIWYRVLSKVDPSCNV